MTCLRWYYSNIKSIIVLLTGDSMAAPSVPADPGWGEDPAWPDRDPVTAAEREAWLDRLCQLDDDPADAPRSEEHTSELQSPDHLVCRLLLEKKKKPRPLMYVIEQEGQEREIASTS